MAKKKKLKNINWKTIAAITLLVLGIWFLREGGLSPTTTKGPQIQEEVTQLASPDEDYEGSAMASRRVAADEFSLNLTAFLENTTRQAEYGVWLSNEEDTMFIGSLQMAGDVYTLNFRSDNDYETYNGITIAVLESEEEMGEVLLTGSF